MAYSTFTDALMQAKRAAKLRGLPFSTRDIQNIHGSYMTGAAERVSGERSQALGEKSLEAQKSNWASVLAQNRDISGQTLAQQLGIEKERWGLERAGIESAEGIARAGRESEERNIAAGLASAAEIAAANREQARLDAAAQAEAADKAANKALTGNVISTGAGLGGAAYLLAPSAAPTATGLGFLTSGAGTVAGAEAGGVTAGAAAGTLAYTGVGAAGVAGGYIGAELGQPVGKALGIGGEAERSIGGGIVGGAAAGAAVGSVVPGVGTVVGGVVGGIVGGVTGLIKSKCIIVTACTDRHSPEVEIAREFRDKFLDADQRRGYYMIAGKIVPFIESNGTVRRLVKKWLVNRLVDYGAVVLGLKPIMALRSSWIVSRLFLTLIRAVGKTRVQFIRNGEVY